MDLLFYKLKKYSIGLIVFSSFAIISLTLFACGKLNLFYSSYDPFYDNPNDWIVIQGVEGILSSYISHVIWVISISVFGIFMAFWLLFAVMFCIISTQIDLKLKLHIRRYAIINFFTFCLGAIMSLAISNALLENRKDNEYIDKTKDF